MRSSIVVLLAAAGTLEGCDQQGATSGPGPKSQGRYAGIGTYDAGTLWSQMSEGKAPADPAAARLEDDDQVIVVVDSHSGEVRQCGNHSGFCVTMNPWAAQGPRTEAPVKLKKHMSDLVEEAQSETEKAAQPASSAAPAE